MMARIPASALLALSVVAALSTGCDSESTKPPSDPKTTGDPILPYSSVWSADDGIDLFGRSSELIRAGIEAGEYTSYVGLSETYPGYEQAIGSHGGEARCGHRRRVRSFDWSEQRTNTPHILPAHHRLCRRR